MVGKLIKNELKILFRSLLYVGIAAVGLSFVAMLMIKGGKQNSLSSLGGIIISTIAIFMALGVCFAGFVVSITTFVRTLFSAEGYMTFSLPVSATQLIVAKLVSAIITIFYGVVVVAISLTIVFLGFPQDIFQELADIFGTVFEAVESYFSSDPMLAVEAVIGTVVEIPCYLLIIYLLASIGQLFTKNRKVFAFVIAFGFLFVVQPLLQSYCIKPIFNLLEEASEHLKNWVEIVLYLGVDVGCFFGVRYILTNKLNLLV